LKKATRSAKLLVLGRQGLAASSLAVQFPELVSFDVDEEPGHEKAIATTIKHKVLSLCKKWRSPQLSSIITEKLTLTANGMYLLPMMTIKSLTKTNPTLANIERVLNKLPDDLMSAYRQVLDRIQECDRHLAGSVLLWVTFATRPMSLEELSSAVAVNDCIMDCHDLKMNTSINILSSPGVLELLGPVLKVSEARTRSVVSLAHHSAREFLLSVDLRCGPPSWLLKSFCGSGGTETPESVEELRSQSNRQLANRCFRYYALVLQPGCISQQELSTKARLTASRTSYLSYSDLRQAAIGNEDTKIYDTICELTQVTSRIDPVRVPQPRDYLEPFGRPFSSRHEGSVDKEYRFTLPQELMRTGSGGSISRNQLVKAIQQFPALRYCIENLPEHARSVTPSNMLFHKSLAAFLHSKIGAGWIENFWRVRDPGQLYGKQPAIHFASVLALAPEIMALLASGRSADERDQYGNTALDAATSTGCVDIIRLLLETGKADLHANQMLSLPPDDSRVLEERRDVLQRSNVLHTAACYGHKEAAIYLLGAGSNPLDLDKDGLTPVDIAVSIKNGPLVKLLMDKPSVWEAVSFAVQRGRVETLKWLVEEEHVDPFGCFRTSEGTVIRNDRTDPLRVAIRHNQTPCARYLSTLIRPGEECIQDAYYYAARNGTTEILQFLITNSMVDINLVDGDGRSALHHACLEGKVAAVSLLIRAGIDTGLTDCNGYTALELLLAGEDMRCSYEQQKELMSLFREPWLREKPPIRGGNLLHLALELGPRKRSEDDALIEADNYEFIEMLLDWGLDPLERDSLGRTILHAAATGTNPLLVKVLDICDLVTAQGNLGQTPLHTLLRSGRPLPPGSIQALIERMPSLEVRDNNGRTPVHDAVMHCQTEVLDMLLERGQAVNLQDNEGMAPVHVLSGCSASWSWETVSKLRRLLQSGADLQLGDNKGRTALDIVISEATKDNFWRYPKGLLTVLVENGPALSTTSHDKMTMGELFQKLVTSCFKSFPDQKRTADAGLVLASLYSAQPNTSTKSTAELAANISPEIDPAILLPDFQKADPFSQVRMLTFLAEHGASDSCLLYYFNFLDNNGQRTPENGKFAAQFERFPGERRLSFLLAAQRGEIITPADKRKAIFRAATRGDVRALQTYTEDMKWNVTATVDAGNRTVLSLASEEGRVDVVRYLLEKGAPTEARDNYGRTALYLLGGERGEGGCGQAAG
jgi:ankyrin repeat protein